MRAGDQGLALPKASFLVTDGRVFWMDIMKTYANMGLVEVLESCLDFCKYMDCQLLEEKK